LNLRDFFLKNHPAQVRHWAPRESLFLGIGYALAVVGLFFGLQSHCIGYNMCLQGFSEPVVMCLSVLVYLTTTTIKKYVEHLSYIAGPFQALVSSVLVIKMAEGPFQALAKLWLGIGCPQNT